MKHTAFFILLVSSSIHAMDYLSRPSSPQPNNTHAAALHTHGYRAGCLEVYDQSHSAQKQTAHPASPRRQSTNNNPAQKITLPRVASLTTLLKAARIDQ